MHLTRLCLLPFICFFCLPLCLSHMQPFVFPVFVIISHIFPSDSLNKGWKMEQAVRNFLPYQNPLRVTFGFIEHHFKHDLIYKTTPRQFSVPSHPWIEITAYDNRCVSLFYVIYFLFYVQLLYFFLYFYLKLLLQKGYSIYSSKTFWVQAHTQSQDAKLIKFCLHAVKKDLC